MKAPAADADAQALQELVTYGLKGVAAYADHAQILGQEDDAVYAFFHEALDFLRSNPTTASTSCSGWSLQVRRGQPQGHGAARRRPTPAPTAIRCRPRSASTPVKGKAILVSGHDLKDLEELLKQTEGKGINIYTHGEMLPGHGYPGLKKYKHLVGNYGGAWQDQAQGVRRSSPARS